MTTSYGRQSFGLGGSRDFASHHLFTAEGPTAVVRMRRLRGVVTFVHRASALALPPCRLVAVGEGWLRKVLLRYRPHAPSPPASTSIIKQHIIVMDAS